MTTEVQISTEKNSIQIPGVQSQVSLLHNWLVFPLFHAIVSPILIRTSSQCLPFPSSPHSTPTPLTFNNLSTRKELLKLLVLPSCRPHLCPPVPNLSRLRGRGALSTQSFLLQLCSGFHYFLIL